MAKIELITAGGQKFELFKNFEEGYKKKINRFITFKASSVKIKNFRDETRLIETEGDKMLEKIDKSDHVVVLDREGREMSSIDFSVFISKVILRSSKKIIFVIGSAGGLSENIIRRSDERISFSKMTFPHDLFKIIFLEQLYRAFTIINKQKYHR